MCVGSTSMLTASAVTTAAESLRSDAERVDAIEQVRFELGEIGARVADRQRRSAAFFASSADASNVPPMPTPTMIGGQALAPARSTVSTTTR